MGRTAKRRAWRPARTCSSKITSVYLELGAIEPNANVCLRSQLLVTRVTVALIVWEQMIRIESPHLSQTYFWNPLHVDSVLTLSFLQDKSIPKEKLYFSFSAWGKNRKWGKGKGKYLWWIICPDISLSFKSLHLASITSPQLSLSLVPKKDVIESS